MSDDLDEFSALQEELDLIAEQSDIEAAIQTVGVTDSRDVITRRTVADMTLTELEQFILDIRVRRMTYVEKLKKKSGRSSGSMKDMAYEIRREKELAKIQKKCEALEKSEDALIAMIQNVRATDMQEGWDE